MISVIDEVMTYKPEPYTYFYNNAEFVDKVSRKLQAAGTNRTYAKPEGSKTGIKCQILIFLTLFFPGNLENCHTYQGNTCQI